MRGNRFPAGLRVSHLFGRDIGIVGKTVARNNWINNFLFCFCGSCKEMHYGDLCFNTK